MPEKSCPFCRHQVSRDWCSTRCEYGTTYSAHECTSCGTTYLWPPPSESQLQKAYATVYYGAGESKFNPLVEGLRDACANLRLKKLSKNLTSHSHILDIGCGDGRLLRTFHQAGFHNLHGTELPGRAAERASKIPGIELYLGTLATLDLAPATFDLVTLVHVYEHLPAPRDTLDQIARLLKPGGRLFLSFPNIRSWQARFTGGHWFHLDPPRHLTLVPPQVVISHLKSKGFKLVAEEHLCMEQNLYGWIQSVLNLCDPQRNFLYERLKQNRNYLPDRGTGSLILHAGLGGLLLLPSLFADCCSALAKSGATIELLFERPTAN